MHIQSALLVRHILVRLTHTNRETCVSSPVEHGTSLQKFTSAIIIRISNVLFKTQLHSRSRQRSRSCSKTLRHSIVYGDITEDY